MESITIGNGVLYRTPMLQMVEAEVVMVTANEEDPQNPFLDLRLFDPTLRVEVTVHEIEHEPQDFPGLVHTWRRL